MNDNGQTNIDFLIGMSIFLLSVAFVLALIPSVFEPFAADSGSNSLVADRAATTMVEDVLGEPGDPAVLNTTCTTAFFDETVPPGCSYTTTDLNDALAISATTRLNATIEKHGSIRTIGATRLAAGPVPPTRSSSVVISRRVVLLDGDDYRLNVRVW